MRSTSRRMSSGLSSRRSASRFTLSGISIFSFGDSDFIGRIVIKGGDGYDANRGRHRHLRDITIKTLYHPRTKLTGTVYGW